MKSRAHGRKRVQFYGCTSYHKRGSAVCTNSLEVAMLPSDAAVLEAIEDRVLTADVVTTSVKKALARLQAQVKRRDTETTRLGLESRLKVIERELERLTAAITAGGTLPTLIDALRTREAERVQVRQELAVHCRAMDAARLDVRDVGRDLRAKLDDWKGLLHRQTPQARQVLKKLLAGPILFTPNVSGTSRSYDFKATISLSQMLSGTVLATMVASPTIPSWNQIVAWLRDMAELRDSGIVAA